MNISKKTSLGLTIGALGVVFGDIGTSPLYALSAAFGKLGFHIDINSKNVFGTVSLIIWSIVLVVSIKFIFFIMRADNEGEGGIMALVSLIKRSQIIAKYKWFFIILGVVGVALFYGDSTITPAISVLSAVEGLKVINSGLNSLVVPITLVILASLFIIQKYGTSFIGHLFGPIMLVWFATIGIAGGLQVFHHPDVLIALSPTTAINFFRSEPGIAFIAMGAVVLAITGTEALYADMGHFGRKPIARSWFWIVLPSLLLCYMGEGALLVHNSSAAANPLFLLFPLYMRTPAVILATISTVIASQAVISGAFSLTKQAVQLDFLPKMLITHTSSKQGGQIYLPFVNAALFVITLLLVIMFGSSVKLANAYGIAVSGTLAIDTILYLVVIRSIWHRKLSYLLTLGILIIPIDLLFVASTFPKILQGGWVPLLIGFSIFVLINTWLRGQVVVVRERRALEGSLQDFIDKIQHDKPSITRLPGTAVYIGHHADLAPLALHATFQDLHELQEQVVIVSVEITTSSHIPEKDRAIVDDLGYDDDGIYHVSLRYGFHDSINIPESLRAVHKNHPVFKVDLSDASYFISLSRVI
ncbi:MAG: potassium transporter Kup, partial [Candidatus Saccharimonadales bacterium]